MIEELRSKENDNNCQLIAKLEEFIKEYDIKNIDDLANLEEYFFMVDNEKVDKLDYCLDKLNHDDYIFAFMDQKDIEEIYKLKDLCNSENDYQKKLLYIIKIFDIAGYNLYLPYTAYQYIMNDQL